MLFLKRILTKEGGKMRYQWKNKIAIFLILIFSIILPYSAFTDSPESRRIEKGGCDACYIQQDVDEWGLNVIQKGYVFQKNGIRSSVQDSIQSNVNRLQIFFLIIETFLLVICLVRVFLMCLKSLLYQARFLCELFTLYQKDGKKRSAFM